MEAAILATLDVPGPTVTALTAPFWQGAAAGKLMLQRCATCGRFVFYPRGRCPHCWGRSLTWQAASGRGTLQTWSVVHRPGHPAWQAAAPYAVGLVRLAEGPTMLSLLLVPEDKLALGLPVSVTFRRTGDHTLPCFEAAS